MSALNIPTIQLNDGTSIPIIGYGTGTAWYKTADSAAVDRDLVEAAKSAMKLGFNHLDCAENYGTEPELGQAIQECGVPRAKLFVTTKVGASVRDIQAAIDASLKKLKLDYVDLYLIHNPFWAKTEAELQEAWAVMEQVKASGKARSIGVSNFLKGHLETILKTAKVIPVVNQIELHPYLQRGDDLVSFQESKNIKTVSYAGLTPITRAKGGPLDPLLTALAKKYGVSEAEILLRWSLDRKFVAITTSSKESRLASYLHILTFKLNPEEVEEISRLGQRKHYRAFWDKHFGPDDRL
ncbi:putative ketoreductase [Talaromyces proteolyticus]|uniref:D-xylose reductase [NAD(P)H] n=1 Tax=Talaromyces proteolyticus TaxID=1131652 RepID=A0AAD4PXQ6_9EURO|nr:putative ketoreductase [Talaromyces proteolyticus]KAH8693579.1 putative ketoreductase [Talaromyces proteolyticus]